MRSKSGVQRLGLSRVEHRHCRDCFAERELRSLVSRHGTPLLIIDCAQVRQNYCALRAALPEVTIHYAVKALPEATVLASLYAEDCNFDVASVGEIDLLREQRIEPERVIHTHPIKTPSEIERAIAYGCDTFVFDNEDELAKFKPYRDRVKLLLRLGFRNADATVDLSKKFGAALPNAIGLLELARRFGLSTVGFSFHVGSQCANSRAHVNAIEACAELLNSVEIAGLPRMRLLDIGGGFPAPYTSDVPTIEDFCAPIRAALGRLPSHVRVVSEPGRYLVASAGHSAATVVGKAEREGAPWYYLDDGIYGLFGARVFDGIEYPLSVLPGKTSKADRIRPTRVSHLAGPTCDSGDMIADAIPLPSLEIGDVLIAHVMGAYTSVTANAFNSVARAKIISLDGPAAFAESGSMLKVSAE